MRGLVVGIVLALGITAVFTTGACGTGSGGPRTPNGLLNGRYVLLATAGESDDEVWATWGAVTSDGAGTFTEAGASTNEAGSLGHGFPLPPSPYHIEINRRIAWMFTLDPDQQDPPYRLEGGITADGAAACMASTERGNIPGVVLLLRQGVGFDDASLDGDWYLVAMGHDHVLLESWARWGTVTFDGAGAASVTGSEKQGGGVSPWSAPAGTYGVWPEGAVELDLGTGAMIGGMLAGGEIMVLCGGRNAGEQSAIFVLIRLDGSASAATLNGPYHMVEFAAADGQSPRFFSWTGTASSDGVGTLTIDAGGTGNSGGNVITTPTTDLTHPYSVRADGSLDVGTGDSLGAVSPTGGYAAYLGSLRRTATELRVLIR